MNAGLELILTGSAALFAVGAFAIVARRSALMMLIGTQFMFMAACLAFVAFARFGLGAVNATSGAAVAIFAGATAVARRRARRRSTLRWLASSTIKRTPS